jgi:hypothetical protein
MTVDSLVISKKKDKLVEYKNGNTTVTIYKDGTKVREFEGIPVVEHPESMDIKITNYCDLGCPYCHENSTIKGKHSDLFLLKEKLDILPAGIELALGGGNPLSHPNLVQFLEWCKTKGFIANITINEKHINKYNELIIDLITRDLVKGIGISVTEGNINLIKSLYKLSSNIVLHLIVGINTIEQIEELCTIKGIKVLLLGYKTFGRGISYYSQDITDNINKWYKHLPTLVGKLVLSFDNLAIEQLNVKRLFTSKGWDRFYMGDDFTFTMYIDAVEQQYAPTSRSDDRQSFKDYNVIQYFKTFKNK